MSCLVARNGILAVTRAALVFSAAALVSDCSSEPASAGSVSSSRGGADVQTEVSFQGGTGGADVQTEASFQGGTGGAATKAEPPSDATVSPTGLVADWAFNIDFSCDGDVEAANATLRLNADGTFAYIEAGSSFPGIWYVENGTITIRFYFAGPSEGEPKGSAFTGSVIDFDTRTLSGSFVSPLLSGGGCWSASR